MEKLRGSVLRFSQIIIYSHASHESTISIVIIVLRVQQFHNKALKAS